MVTRTLLAAGYAMSGVHRQPTHIEFRCERTTRLGAKLQLLIAITEDPSFQPAQIAEISYAANNQNRSVAFVSSTGGTDQMSESEFFEALGGAVPPWRVLTADFAQHLTTAARNELPHGLLGEPWLVFEDLVADGVEFCFGRRVNRLGGHRRAKKVSDMIAPLPDFNVLVIDAKASAEGFDAKWASLRPLVEYVQKQKIRQKGGGEVVAALVVSSRFQRADDDLASVAQEFLGETRIPLCLMTADTLAQLVNQLLRQPDLRGAIRWNMLFNGGLITMARVQEEIAAAQAERCELRDL